MHSVPSPAKQKAISIWLFGLCALIICVIVIGGFTRLTHSGLSIVNWEPISGIVPPFSQQQWHKEFDNYQKFPEFQVVRPDTTLEQFKRIFWIEYIHRVAARSIAIVFLLPYIFFLLRGYLGYSAALRLAGVFVLGALQGLLGWYMVQSGLIDNPAVSQYRLTAHLGLAVLIYGILLWFAVGYWYVQQGDRPEYPENRRKICITIIICIVVVALMQLNGGFMAGTHAGFVYNTFPDMNGQFLPDEVFALDPLWRNLFENVAAIQFVHRWTAVVVLLAIVYLWLSRFQETRISVRKIYDIAAAVVILQIILGITTLLSRVEIVVALVHQFGFICLLSVLIVLLRIQSWPHRTPHYLISQSTRTSLL